MSRASSCLLLALCLLLSLSLSSACEFADCDHVDFGSCGNACCKLYIYIDGESTTDVMAKLNHSITVGGPDGRFLSVKTAGGGMNFNDLRQYNLDVDFIGQTWHTTEKRIYNDTINLTVAPVKKSSDINVSKTDTTITKTYAVPSLDTVNKNRSEHDSGEASTLTTVVTAFSISQIGGAYGDDGQNFFNIKSLFDSIKWRAGHYRLKGADDSCPAPSPQRETLGSSDNSNANNEHDVVVF